MLSRPGATGATAAAGATGACTRCTPRTRGRGSSAPLSDVCAGGVHVDRKQRLARGHEQPVSLQTAEADVCAVLRQADHADALAPGREDLHTGPRAGPDVAIDVAADAVSGRRGAGARDLELGKGAPTTKRGAV